jgi:hypothetical protein
MKANYEVCPNLSEFPDRQPCGNGYSLVTNPSQFMMARANPTATVASGILPAAQIPWLSTRTGRNPFSAEKGFLPVLAPS